MIGFPLTIPFFLQTLIQKCFAISPPSFAWFSRQLGFLRAAPSPPNPELPIESTLLDYAQKIVSSQSLLMDVTADCLGDALAKLAESGFARDPYMAELYLH
jgi:hypothetical protein